MGGWSIEDALAMERRHVLEGEKRIARQEALAANLSWKGRDKLAFAANDLLALLRETLELSKTRCRELESQFGNPPRDGGASDRPRRF
jgi:hypothetical protein